MTSGLIVMEYMYTKKMSGITSSEKVFPIMMMAKTMPITIIMVIKLM